MSLGSRHPFCIQILVLNCLAKLAARIYKANDELGRFDTLMVSFPGQQNIQ